MKDKRRLLLIAYCYPPMSAVGSIRAHNISKYLARLGWHVTVVTPGARSGYAHEDFHKVERPLTGEGITVVQTGHSLRRLNPEVLKCRDTVLGYLVGGCLRRAARLLDLEREIGWRPHLRKACRKFRPGDFDVILATGSPFFAFEVARELSQGLTCPFIVDYRDLWNGNVMTRVHRKSIVKREEAVLRYCSSATIVSPSLKQYLEQRFHVNGKVHVITNGFDPEECERVEPHSFDHFAIVYAGIFYPSLRTITPVMQALHSVANTFDPDGWRFHYYGGYEAHVFDEADKYGVRAHVVGHGECPREEVLSAVKGADITVVITNTETQSSLDRRGMVTGKIFEAIGLGSRVLLVAPENSDAASIVAATRTGRQFVGTDWKGMADFIIHSMTASDDRPTIPDEYSWPELAKQLDGILNAVCLERGSTTNGQQRMISPGRRLLKRFTPEKWSN